MSAVQVQGKQVDQRSDIFAFGCILYEAAAGRKPFQGDSIIDSLHKLIYSQPAPIIESNPSAPAELQRIIRKCIAKDPDERYQSAKDIAIDLRALVVEIDSGSFVHTLSQPVTASQSNTDPNSGGQQTLGNVAYDTATSVGLGGTDPSGSRTLPRTRITPRVIAVAITASLAVFALLYMIIGMKHGRARPGGLFQNRKIAKLTSSGTSWQARISADGKYVAYIVSDQGQQSIWLRQVATSINLPIVPAADVDYKGLAFSPDGNYIYYSAQEKGKVSHSLYQVASLGGNPKKVLDQVSGSI